MRFRLPEAPVTRGAAVSGRVLRFGALDVLLAPGPVPPRRAGMAVFGVARLFLLRALSFLKERAWSLTCTHNKTKIYINNLALTGLSLQERIIAVCHSLRPLSARMTAPQRNAAHTLHQACNSYTNGLNEINVLY